MGWQRLVLGGPRRGDPRGLGRPSDGPCAGGEEGLRRRGARLSGPPELRPAAAPTCPPRRPRDPSLQPCGGPGAGGPRSGGAHLAQQPSSGARCLRSVVLPGLTEGRPDASGGLQRTLGASSGEALVTRAPAGTGLCRAVSVPNFAVDEVPSAEIEPVPSVLRLPGDVSRGPAVAIHTVA